MSFKHYVMIMGVAAFFALTHFLFGSEYDVFISSSENSRAEIIAQSKYLQNFRVEDVLDQDIKGTDLYITPSLDLLDSIVQEIDTAKSRVYLATYIFTETRIAEALIRAHKRGVDVQVLLEANPYKAPHLNDKMYNYLNKKGVSVSWHHPGELSLHHEKYIIIDDSLYLSTGNFTYSLFKHNRDLVLALNDTEIVGVIEQLFLYDSGYSTKIPYHDILLISPYNSREKIHAIIESAKLSLHIYFPYFADDEFIELLDRRAKEGIDVYIITSKDFYFDNTELIDKFYDSGIKIVPQFGSKLHAKMIMLDSATAYIGSVNASYHSFESNREIGIILNDERSIKKLKKNWESDFLQGREYLAR